MKVNKESLVKLIELVVRKEIKSAVNEIKQAVETSVVNEQSGKPTTSIKQALEETYESRQDWPSVNGDKPYDQLGWVRFLTNNILILVLLGRWQRNKVI